MRSHFCLESPQSGAIPLLSLVRVCVVRRRACVQLGTCLARRGMDDGHLEANRVPERTLSAEATAMEMRECGGEHFLSGETLRALCSRISGRCSLETGPYIWFANSKRRLWQPERYFYYEEGTDFIFTRIFYATRASVKKILTPSVLAANCI